MPGDRSRGGWSRYTNRCSMAEKASRGRFDPGFYRTVLTRRGKSRPHYVARSRIKRMARLAEGNRFLDIGVGGGELIRELLAPRDERLVVGIDITSVLLAKRAEAIEAGHFAIADAEHLPFRQGAFNTVFMGEVLEHLRNPKKAIEDVHEVLTDGGCLVFSVPNKFGLWSIHVDTIIAAIKGYNPEGHVSKFTLGALKRLFRDKFELEEVYNTAVLGSSWRVESLMRMDVRLARHMPHAIANGWVIKARKKAQDRTAARRS